MTRITVSLVAIAGLAGMIATAAPFSRGMSGQPSPQAGTESAAPPERSAKEVRGSSPYIELKDEPAPKLIVDPPLPNLLDHGVVWIQWRVENVNILPVFGKGAVNVSPRVGHLHIHVDDVPWWWADASNINTIDLAGMPPGPHKVRIVLVDSNHEPFPGQSKTVEFTVPNRPDGTTHPHR